VDPAAGLVQMRSTPADFANYAAMVAVHFVYSIFARAFLTAQIAGHDVVYSVILRHAEHPFNREGVERHFAYECPPISN
jgi:hypothetical protein